MESVVLSHFVCGKADSTILTSANHPRSSPGKSRNTYQFIWDPSMESVSKPDGGVVNMTRAMEALSPWLNNPRRTIIQVEALVLAAAALLLLQFILGSCRRRWHSSFLKYILLVCNGIMFPLNVYTLGTMQSSPIKNSNMISMTRTAFTRSTCRFLASVFGISFT